MLTAEGAEIKKGKVTIGDHENVTYLRMYHSLKKLVWAYLDQHDANIVAMGRKVVDQLAAEL